MSGSRLTAVCALVVAFLVGIFVWLGPHEWDAYLPSLAVAVIELTVGAALVAGYLELRRSDVVPA